MFEDITTKGEHNYNATIWVVVRSQTSPELLLSKGTDPSSVTPTSFRA